MSRQDLKDIIIANEPFEKTFYYLPITNIAQF